MNVDRYLQRINYRKRAYVDQTSLIDLHYHHVLHVPFENLDIHFKKPFDLEPQKVYQKVVTNLRGGFCYEVNSLFNALLTALGFNSKIISAKIIDEFGTVGPKYDHMAIIIEMKNILYLADVGYGDLFTKPLVINDGIQPDARNQFKIQRTSEDELILSMSGDGVNFQKKYSFSLEEVPVEKFNAICQDKQTNPSSYFVKNRICTKPTRNGRLTLINDRFIEKTGIEKLERIVRNDHDLRDVLKKKFALDLPK